MKFQNNHSAEDMFFKEISSLEKHDLICGKVFDEGEDKFPDID